MNEKSPRLRPRRPSDNAFTLVELLVVVVIIGIMAAIATPRMRKEGRGQAARDFASNIARDLQRARTQAVAERLPVRAFIYGDRVELRSARAGATPGASPVAPTLADPILRIIQSGTEMSIWNALTSSATPPPAKVLTTATYVEVEFSVLGQAQFIGKPTLTSAFIYMRSNSLPAGHPYRDFRIDVNALTGFVGLREAWQ